MAFVLWAVLLALASAMPNARERFAKADLKQYSEDVAQKILNRLAAGEALEAICKAEDMPSAAAVHAWKTSNINGFAERYTRARVEGWSALADEMVEIADNCGLSLEEIAKAKLQIDVRKFCFARMVSSLKIKLLLQEEERPVEEALDTEAFARKLLFVINKMTHEKSAQPNLRQAENALTVSPKE